MYTPNMGEIIGYTETRNLARPHFAYAYAWHVCVEATCDCSAEPAHLHRLVRAYNLRIRQVWKYNYVGQTNMSCLASSNSCVVHAFEEATSEGSNEPAHWHILTRAYSLCIHQVIKYM